MMHGAHGIAVILALAAATAGAAVSGPFLCDTNRTDIWCNQHPRDNPTKLPTIINKDVARMTFGGHGLTRLPEKAFAGLKRLHTLRLCRVSDWYQIDRTRTMSIILKA